MHISAKGPGQLQDNHFQPEEDLRAARNNMDLVAHLFEWASKQEGQSRLCIESFFDPTMRSQI